MTTRRKFLSSLSVAVAGLVLRFRPDEVKQIVEPDFGQVEFTEFCYVIHCVHRPLRPSDGYAVINKWRRPSP